MTVTEVSKDALLSVSLGELKTTRRNGDVLVAFGLGSCIAVCLYDPVVKVAGMAHVVLPEATNGAVDTPGKFGDLALPALLAALVQAGANKQRAILKIAGGAQVLAVPGFNKGFNIGERNAQSVRAAAAREGLWIVASDVGGNVGRTVRLHAESGLVTVHTAGNKVTQL